MLKKTGWVSAGLTVVALSTLASVSLGAGAAEAAVVYCKTVGVPKGCVVREPVAVLPAPVVVVREPVAAVGVVGVGAPGTPLNRGGPVDRVGRR
jgi:hypothetical protein